MALCVVSVTALATATSLGTACSAPTASIPEDAVDAATIVDVLPLDAQRFGGDAGSPGFDAAATCAPGDVSSFKTAYEPPGPVHADACTVDQLSVLVDACFGPDAADKSCNAWVADKKNATCLDCWAGPVTAATWAPVIYDTTSAGGQAIFVNTGGCIALADPTQVTCAQETEYALECVLAACVGSCPIPSSGDTTAASNALYTCINTAATSVCSAFATPANMCTDMLDPDAGDGAADPAAFCYSANTNSEDLLAYLVLACGPPGTVPPPGDGGSGLPDGSDDDAPPPVADASK